MPLELWYSAFSSPSRAVLLTAKALDIDLDLKEVDFFKGDNMTPEYMAMNPQHCVPTLVDGDFVLWESRAICGYLVSQYGEDDTFYPSEAKARARVDRLLYFDIGTLYHRFSQYVSPVMMQGKTPDSGKLESLQEALGWLDEWLAGHDWAMDDTPTIADHSLAASLATVEASGVDLAPHTNIEAWLDRCKSDMPGYNELNAPGAELFGNLFKSQSN